VGYDHFEGDVRGEYQGPLRTLAATGRRIVEPAAAVGSDFEDLVSGPYAFDSMYWRIASSVAFISAVGLN
jgi:hypothetical protein